MPHTTKHDNDTIKTGMGSSATTKGLDSILHGIPNDSRKTVTAYKYAEIPLLIHFHNKIEVQDADKYTSCSRRACYLCYETLKWYKYDTQRFYGVVYEKWDASELCNGPNCLPSITTALVETLQQQVQPNSPYIDQREFQALPYITLLSLPLLLLTYPPSNPLGADKKQKPKRIAFLIEKSVTKPYALTLDVLLCADGCCGKLKE